MKRILAFLYWHTLRRPIRMLARWQEHTEHDYFCYCRRGCENCYAWRCRGRDMGKTPFQKFRR